MNRIAMFLSAIAVSAIGVNAQILHTTCEQGEIEGELHNGYALYKAFPRKYFENLRKAYGK